MAIGNLYKELAVYYDLIYSRKDYKAESRLLRRLIRGNKQSPGKDLLEVGCGTGLYLEQLEKHFSCSGIDISGDMLRIARKRLTTTSLAQGDMRTFDLGAQFDVVLCLFSAIANLKNTRELRRTIGNFSNHLKPGGVLIVSPWRHPGKLEPGMPRLFTYDSPDVKLARIDFPKQRGKKSILDFHWLIGEKGKAVKSISGDHHELMAFSTDQYFKAMRLSKLEPRFLEPEAPSTIGLYVGIKIEA
jgi:SAM-dependent methyltransferase